MKLKTQENIRILELAVMLGTGFMAELLNQHSNIMQVQQSLEMLAANGINLEDINELSKNLYYLDYFTSFRTQKLTIEHKKLKELYGYIISDFCNICEILNIKHSPIKIFALYMYMYRSGYLSYNKDFKYSTDMKDFAGLLGIDVIRGRGVCRSISSMLTDIYDKLGYESYNLSVNATDASIKHLQKLSKISLQTEEKGKKFAKFVSKVTAKLPISNHLITMVKRNGKTYIFDPTNDGMLYRKKGNKIATYDEENACMTNYFLFQFLFNVVGAYDKGIAPIQQIQFFNHSNNDSYVVNNDTYRKEYLETMQLCIDNENLLINFYEYNKKYYEKIYNISKEQRDYIRRLIPIIPRRKDK